MQTLPLRNLAVSAFVTLSLWTGTKADANCIGNETFYTCTDSNGSNYTVSKFGNMTTTTGSNARTGSNWSQNSTTFGNQTFTNGTASDGGAWNMNQTNLGGGYTSLSGQNSKGNSFSAFCGPFGCN